MVKSRVILMSILMVMVMVMSMAIATATATETERGMAAPSPLMQAVFSSEMRGY